MVAILWSEEVCAYARGVAQWHSLHLALSSELVEPGPPAMWNLRRTRNGPAWRQSLIDRRGGLTAAEFVGLALDDAAACRSDKRDDLVLQLWCDVELSHGGTQKIDRTIPVFRGEAHAAMCIRHRTAYIKPVAACGALYEVDNQLLFARDAVSAAIQPEPTELVGVIPSASS